MTDSPIRFAAIGLNHFHIHAQVAALSAAGAEFAAFHAPESELAEGFARQFPDVTAADSDQQILELTTQWQNSNDM